MNTKKLKQLVLDLAIHGKLVPQDPNDEPASELLARIRAERAASQGSASKGKKSAIPSENLDEVPFEVPTGWCWTKIQSIADVKSSKRVFECDYVECGVPFYRSKEIGELYRGNDIETSLFIKKEHFELIKEKYGVPHVGDILITSVGTIGNTWICDGRDFYYKDGNVTQICDNQHIYTPYIEKFLHTTFFDDQLESLTGTAYIALTIEKLNQILIPLPPLSEQRRIVAEIERWFGVIDQLESNEADLKKSIEQTKKKVLDLAIRGKLVKQEKGDEPASELLARIRAEKAEAQGRASKGKKTAIPSVELDEVPFEVPEGWEWTNVGSVFAHNTGKALNKSSKQEGHLLPYITTSNVYWNRFVLGELKSMYFSDSEIDKCTVKKGDLLVCEGGDIGRSAIWNSDETICIQNHIHRLRSYENVNHKFYMYVFQIYKLQNRIDGNGIGLMGLSSNALDKIVIPLPPLSEQRRIVSKIEEVFDLLGRIEEVVKS